MSLVTKYDTREITRVLAKDLHAICNALQVAGVEFEKSRLVRPSSVLFFTSVRLQTFIATFLFGTSSKISKKNEQIIKENYDDILTF